MSKKRKISYYEIFEENLHLQDHDLEKILISFPKRVFISSPILADLIVEKRLYLLTKLYQIGIPFSYNDHMGTNLLHMACGISGSFEMVRFLIENNLVSDPNYQNYRCETPFSVALFYEHIDIVKYFLERFIIKSAIIYHTGETLLDFVKKQNNDEILKLLNQYLISHCCKQMTTYIDDPRVPIKYSKKIRSYSIPRKGKTVVQVIHYCPWCGKKLPKQLRDEYFEILEREYGIEPDLDSYLQPGFPEEFKDDTWWKKRGL